MVLKHVLLAFWLFFSAAAVAQASVPALSAPSLLSGIWRGTPVSYQMIHGLAIYQGDILLEHVDPLPIAQNSSKISPAAATVAYSGYLWPKVSGVATVYYSIDANSAPAATANINQAINQFNTDFTGVIHWSLRTTQTVYVDINLNANDYSGQCQAEEGYQPSYAQPQPMTGSAACTVGTLLHEMGHVIGLWHEHTRSDRNTFVSVNYQNVIKASRGNFDIQQENAENLGLYDYASLMHYPPYVQTRNGGPTLESIPVGIPLGSAEGLPATTAYDYSAADKEGILRLYGAPPSQITVTSNPPGLTVAVDGINYTTPHSFNWALNSSHALSAPSGVQTLNGNIFNSTTATTYYYTYGRWNDSTAQSHTVTVSPGNGESGNPAASPQVSTYSANFIQLVPYNAVVYPVAPPSPGSVAIVPTPQTYAGASGVFLVARQQATLTATPTSGWHFYEFNNAPFWLPGGLGANPKSFYVPDTGNPINTTAEFTQSPIYMVNATPSSFSSNLGVTVDGGFFYTPKNFALPYDSSWMPGSAHTLNIDSQQYPYSYDSRYAFSSWSDGLAQAHSVSALPAGNASYVATLTPQFAPATNFGYPPCGGTATLSPASPTNDGFYPSGQVLTLNETPSNGWSFAGWSNDVTNSVSPTTLTATDESLVYANFNTSSTPLTISSLNPNAMAVGSNVSTLTINGAGFSNRSVVYMNGSYRTVTFINSATLQVPIVAADLASVGNFQLYVENYPAGWNGCAVFAYQAVAVYQGQGPLTFSTNSVVFGATQDNTAATPITVTLNNTGTPAIYLSSLAITGANQADFTLNTSLSTCLNGTTLVPSATCTLSLSFTPSASGTRVAGLQITDNVGSGLQTIALSGTGAAPVSTTSVPIPLAAEIALAVGLGYLGGKRRLNFANRISRWR